MTHCPAPASTPALRSLCLALGLVLGASAWAADPGADHGAAHAPAAAASPPAKTVSQDNMPDKPVDNLQGSRGNAMADKIRAAMAGTVAVSKKMTVTVEDKTVTVTGARFTVSCTVCVTLA